MSDNGESTKAPTIGNLAAALAKAQAKISGVLKSTDNPFFKSKYADLAACWQACHEPLSENEIAVVQTTETVDDKLSLRTTLVHSSGEYISGTIPLLYENKANPMQALGSAITYARRYGLCAAVGLAQEDDDGNSSAPEPKKQPKRRTKKQEPPPKPEPKQPTKYGDARDDLAKAIRESPIDADSAAAVNAAFQHITGDNFCTIDLVFKGDTDEHALDILGRIQQAELAGTPKEAIWSPQRNTLRGP